MKTLKQKESKNLSAFEKFKLNNPKSITGGLFNVCNDEPIDPPKKPGGGRPENP